jgi:protein gp37
MSLNRTGIETADFTWNLYTGCLRGCPFCYARKLARGRLNHVYSANTCVSQGYKDGPVEDPFFPRFWADRIRDPFGVPKMYRSKNPHLNEGTAMIFAIDMGDIFGPWIPESWTHVLMNTIEECPHIFQILTKFPDTLLRWAEEYGLPKNVWAGVTVNNQGMVDPALRCLSQIDAKVTYMCVEPLQEEIIVNLSGIDWLIIGAQTNPLVLPETRWVELLLKEASIHDTPVFLKRSLRWYKNTQEWPAVVT